MTEPQFEDRPTAGAFPEAADDDYPERARVPEVEGPDLPGSDGYIGASSHGTTSAEELEGESLDERLGQEQPETVVDPTAPLDPDESLDYDDEIDGGVVGQLTSPDQGTGPDLEKDEVAHEDASDGAGSPEEAALHLEREV